jgi:hypothetical protein
MSRAISRVVINEPHGITPDLLNYKSALSYAFNFYNQDRDKKDARLYLKTYIKHTGLEVNIDNVSDSDIILTYGWLARMVLNGNMLLPRHIEDLDSYITTLPLTKEVIKVVDKTPRPSVRDYMQDKIAEVIGDLEGSIDTFIEEDKEFDLYNYLQANSIPKPYCKDIEEWARKRGIEFTEVYKTTDDDIKEGYSNISRRKQANLVKMFGAFIVDLERYTQFKKANRKPRVAKAKPPAVQVARIKFKKEDTELGIKSVNPSEMVGASQVWVYNVKYKRLAAYRSDSVLGIQVKGSTLQNYDPDMSECRSIRRPEAFLKVLLDASKVKLRKLLSDLTTKGYDVTGRINDECIIVRVIK